MVFFFLNQDLKKNKCNIIFCLSGVAVRGYPNNVLFFQNVYPLYNDLSEYKKSLGSFIKKYFQYKLFHSSYKNSKFNIFPSLYTKNLFEKKFGKKKNNHVIFHGVNKIKTFKLQSSNKLICISSLEYFKNIFNLVEAVKILDNRNVKFELSIIGPGTLDQISNLKKEISKKNLIGKVKYLGLLNKRKLKEKMLDSRVLINSSSCESFGLPNLEAYVCGLNIVCSDIDVFREILGDKPYYFNPKSPKSIANKIFKALNESRFDKTNIEKIKKKYNWIECTKKTFKILLNA